MASRPLAAHLLVTMHCNLSCRHCFLVPGQLCKGQLDIPSARVVLDRLAEAKILKITVSGGEPLVHPQFGQLWKEIHSRPFRIELNTNGTLLTDDRIDEILGAGPRLSDVMISLDGHDSGSVDSIRGRGTFRALDDSLRRLRRRGISPGFSCTVNRLNKGEVEDIIRYAGRFGSWIKFTPTVGCNPSVDTEILLEPPEVMELSQRLETLDGKYPITVRGPLSSISQKCGPNGSGNWPSFACGGIKSLVTVFPDGTVSPCDLLPDLVLGNILNDSLDGILDAEPTRSVLSRVANGLENAEQCEGCPYRAGCMGGCPVYALSQPERSDVRDPYSCWRLLHEKE